MHTCHQVDYYQKKKKKNHKTIKKGGGNLPDLFYKEKLTKTEEKFFL